MSMSLIQGLITPGISGSSLPSSPGATKSDTSFADVLKDKLQETKHDGMQLEKQIVQQSQSGAPDMPHLATEITQLSTDFQYITSIRDLVVSGLKQLLQTPI
jgi:flagellar hook-basal body complex protein FliE